MLEILMTKTNQLSDHLEDSSGSDVRRFLLARYHAVRRQTCDLCSPLAVEDYVIQSMPDVSPPKWHLAHTSWFFETFLLVPLLKSYRLFHPQYAYLFNSYYETLGTIYSRKHRGLLSRPTTQSIYEYRAYVDEHMEKLVESVAEENWQMCIDRLVLGIHHEQQHQELLCTDIKHIFASNPLKPVYRPLAENRPRLTITPDKIAWIPFDGGVINIGHSDREFAFDNEQPRHHVYLENFYCGSRLVTNAEYNEFIQDGGYQRSSYWLSDGWKTVKEQQWCAPLYWQRIEDKWWSMTLSGMRVVDDNEPVCHVSYYEADAFARWAGKRLLTEAEWEHAAGSCQLLGNFRESGILHPIPAQRNNSMQQIFGDVWEWTQSPYAPYPGYRLPAGAIGEYNGKFMCNQMVLRGGSCVTPSSHMRVTYRNFFFPADRWQFSGIRLGADR